MIPGGVQRPALRGARWFTLLVARRHRPVGPCLVLAPHADDETLGCGGTIAAMRAAGLAVTVAIATDGVGSDRLGRHPEVVAQVRRAEALDAARVLGVAEDDVVFMDLPDGGLTERLDDLTNAVQGLIDEMQPAQILVCSPIDQHPDHAALHRACAAADHRQAVVLEYLVWAWPGWPVSALTASKAGGASVLELFREFAALLRRLRRSNIERHRAAKRSAMASYQSQIGDGSAGRGIPARMFDEFDGRYELLVEPTRSCRDAKRGRTPE